MDQPGRIDLQTFAKMKRRLEELDRAASKADGAMEQTLKRLLDEHGCDGEKAARKLVAKMEAELEEGQRKAAKEITKWEAEFGGKLR